MLYCDSGYGNKCFEQNKNIWESEENTMESMLYNVKIIHNMNENKLRLEFEFTKSETLLDGSE